MEAMRRNRPWEQQTLVNELKQGKELAKQLQNHLNPSTASTETRQFLIEKIISSFEKTITKLGRSGQLRNESPFVQSSLCSGQSDGSQAYEHQDQAAAFKKRKAMPIWTAQVQVKSESGLEGPSEEDGFSWRKYGQKDILGAIHPRGYYRCTHRFVQGCRATKQVQRSDQDPTVFNITFKGQHTCNKAAHSSKPGAPQQEAEIQLVKPTLNPKQVQQQKRQKFGHSVDHLRFSFGVKDELDEQKVFPTFSSFPSTTDNLFDDYVFLQAAAAEEEPSSCFISAAHTSDSDFFLPAHVGSFGLSQLNVDISESDLAEAAGSCLNSVSNSPMGVLDLDFELPFASGSMEFDPNFPFSFLDFH